MLLSLLLTLASGRASVRRHGRGKERGEPRVQGLDPPRGMVALLESKAEKTYRQESRDDPEEGNGEESKDAEKEAAETEGAEKEGAETEGMCMLSQFSFSTDQRQRPPTPTPSTCNMCFRTQGEAAQVGLRL